MKKRAFCLITMIAATSSLLFADPTSGGGANTPSPAIPPNQQGQGQMMQGQMMQAPDCSQLTQDEQNFAAQIMNMNNRTLFCNQFTSQERQQAMQMMGQKDSSGNAISADQAVQQVLGSGAQQTTRANRGCPVKQ
jgi:hypothetical protein